MARRILVVDDNRDSADSLAALLRLLGHEIAVAYDGIAALDLAGRFLPEVVLLDLDLPGLDGRTVARRIRAEPWGQGMLLIASTGWGPSDDADNTLDAGFDFHMTKPMDLDKLSKLLANRG